MKSLDAKLSLKDLLKALLIGGALYILFGVANGNRFTIGPIACAAAASLIFACIIIWKCGIRLMTLGAVAWTAFAVAYTLCYYTNQLISLIVYNNGFSLIGRLTTISLTIIIFAVLFAMLLWRTFSSHDFTDDKNQRQFIRCFRPILIIMLVFYCIVILDFMFIRRFALNDYQRYLLLVPFGTIIDQLFFLDLSGFDIFCQICGNLFLLTPIGFVAKSRLFGADDISRITNNKIKFTRIKQLSTCTKKIIYYALPFVISLFFEVMQYIFAVGYSDIDDIILNSAGYFLGALVISILSRLRNAKTHGLDKDILRIVK